MFLLVSMMQVTPSHLHVQGLTAVLFFYGIRYMGDVERGGRAHFLNNVLERDALWLHEDPPQVASTASMKRSSNMMFM